MKEFKEVRAGEENPLLTADGVTAVHKALNALFNGSVSPSTAGSIKYQDGNWVITLSGGGGVWQSKTVCHLGAAATQSFYVKDDITPI